MKGRLTMAYDVKKCKDSEIFEIDNKIKEITNSMVVLKHDLIKLSGNIYKFNNIKAYFKIKNILLSELYNLQDELTHFTNWRKRLIYDIKNNIKLVDYME